MGILRVRRCLEPRAPRDIGSLCDQQHGAVLRVAPESLGPVDGCLLDRAVHDTGYVGCCAKVAEADERSNCARSAEMGEGVALEIRSTVIETELGFAKLSFRPHQGIARVHRRQMDIAAAGRAGETCGACRCCDWYSDCLRSHGNKVPSHTRT